MHFLIKEVVIAEGPPNPAPQAGEITERGEAKYLRKEKGIGKISQK